MAVILPASVFSAPPQLPHILYGTVTNNGNNVPVGTVIIAKVDDVEKGRTTVSVTGEYGGPNALDEKLLVQGGLSSSDVVKFYIGNNVAEGDGVHFSSGIVRELNLIFAFDKVTVDSTALTSLVTDGTFSVTGSNTSASSIEVVQKTLLNVGSNAVTLPQGTTITKVGGGNFDVTALTAAETAVGSLSGLGTGVVAKGALQWGIASLGLEFNPAIDISIYVGTSLNGQTLNITRSTSGSSGWTSDGIVSPATCVVTAGSCSFSATKASYYVASETTVVNSGGGGGGSTYTYYTMTSSAGENGSISPSGTGTIIAGGDRVYTITPNEGYRVANVIVDDVSKGAITTFTFNDVSANHTISATFISESETMGDINGDGKVDKYDFALMMADWGKTGTGLAADLNSDGKVDKYDFALLMVNWSIS